MKDTDKTKKQLIEELTTLRDKVKELELLTEKFYGRDNVLTLGKLHADTFLDLIPVAIFTKDVDGRYTSVNADTLTYWTQNPVGYTDAEILPREIANKLREVDLQVMETGQEYYVEEQLLAEDGLRTLLSRKVPLRGLEGEVIGILGISLNITEQKQAKEHHIQLEIEKERIRLLSNFITQVSHEFRTPLSVIKTSSHLLGNATTPEKRSQYQRKIQHQADNIEILIENMITLSWFDSNQTLDSVKVELNHILQDIHRIKQHEADEKNIICLLELNPEPLHVMGNEGYFVRAIEHIWDNALQHTPEGGQITVRSHHMGQNAVIDIIDTGKGIANADLPHIFERFYRADKSGSTRGFGLGLPIAKFIFAHYEGTLEVESTSEAGTVLRITLPIMESS